MPWEGKSGEWWINRVGIGLLLLGVAFLFKYTVDQGWLTPPIRIALGLALGVALAYIGFKVERKERWFSQVMLGGSSATFYITGFAAYQIFGLVNYALALSFMIAITVFTFSTAVREDEASLSVLAALGGLGTPFLLYTGGGTLPGLMAYTIVVLIGASAIYLHRGWLTLLWTTVLGGLAVVTIGFNAVFGGWLGWVFSADALSVSAGASLGNKWALQAVTLVSFAAFWLLPVTRESFSMLGDERFPRPAAKTFAHLGKEGSHRLREQQIGGLVISIPIVTFFFTTELWSLPYWIDGLIALAIAALFAGAGLKLQRRGLRGPMVAAHAVSSAVLLAIALQHFFSGHTLLLTWAVEAAALHFVAKKFDSAPIERTAHALFVVVAFWLLTRLDGGAAADPVFNRRGMTDLLVIGSGAATLRLLRSRGAFNAYGLITHLALLGWLWRELSGLGAGAAYVSISWGVYAVALLALGVRRKLDGVRKIGLWTLFGTVAKLFVIDLAQVAAIWRILLFLGFGGMFLFLSYYFRTPAKEDSAEGSAGGI